MYGSPRNQAIQALLDREFLEKLKTASIEKLEVLLKNHSHKNSPAWKRVAIARAIGRKQKSNDSQRA